MILEQLIGAMTKSGRHVQFRQDSGHFWCYLSVPYVPRTNRPVEDRIDDYVGEGDSPAEAIKNAVSKILVRKMA